jgi:nitroreductase
MTGPEYNVYKHYSVYSPEEMKERAAYFYELLKHRRSVRQFSDRAVPRKIIEYCLRAAATAPSGANMQPWYFVAVADPEVKHQIRVAAEKEEQAFYETRASQQWLETLKPLGTDANKPFLQTAPYLIVVFAQNYSFLPGGKKQHHYYVSASVGIATGMLITALHNCGVASLPYTPARMRFLNNILQRPENERPFLILAVGFPAEKANVPDLSKKSFHDFTRFV